MSRKAKKSIEELLNDIIIPKEKQPNVISSNWKWVKLGDVIDLISGRDISVKQCNSNGKGIPYIMGASNIVNDKLVIERWIEKPTVLGKKGDILISVKGTVGKLIIQEVESVHLSRQIMALRTKKNIDNKYLFYYMHTYVNKLIEASKGVIPGISRVDILEAPFPLAPIKEQKRIVGRVERLLNKIDEANQLIVGVKDSFKLRQSSLLDKAFSGELTESWRNNKTDIGLKSRFKQDFSQAFNEVPYNLPEGWKWVTINDIAEVKGGKRLPKGESLVKENTGLPYIKAGNLKNGTVILVDLEFLLPGTQEKIKKYTVSAGDVYITIVGANIGDCGIIPKDLDGANLTENAAKIYKLKDCNNEYLSYWLSSPHGQKIIKSKISSAAQGKLALSRIKTILVPLPSIEEQVNIINIVKSFISKEKQVEKIIPNSGYIDKLKQSILSKAFRGELGTNNPTKESAIEILKELLINITNEQSRHHRLD